MGGKNRIVVDYGDYEGLVLLGTFDTSGKEYDIEMWRKYGFEVVKRYPKITDYSVLKKFIPDTKEGYVVKFSNGDRIKIKGEEYLKSHKLISNVSTTAIWEMLSEGRDVLEAVKDVPDEFYKKIKLYVADLNYNYYRYSEYAGKIYQYFRYGKYGDRDPEPTKKEFAEHLVQCEVKPIVKAICFAMWDNKDYDKIIWKHIKPEFRRL